MEVKCLAGACAWFAGLLILGEAVASRGEPAESGAPAQAETAALAPLTLPQPYMRVAHEEDGTVALQIAVREFLPASGTGPVISLTAVSHVGETNYYRELEAYLAGQGLVLFEGVGFDKADYRRRQRLLENDPDARAGEGSLQTLLARSLDVAFQLDAVHYDQENFQNSDMSIEEIQSLMVRELEKAGQDGVSESNPEFLALMAAMEGSSWLGAFLHIGVRLLGTHPKLKAMTRLMLIEVLGGVRGDLSQMQGLPPDVQELLRVLIQERNGVVLRDLRVELDRESPPASLAVFYGAAHMDNMEQRLRKDLGYRPGTERWMTALSVNPARAGLSELEIQTIRGLIDMQLGILRQSTDATPPQTGSP